MARPEEAAVPGQGAVLLALYDRALPEVYGYLVAPRAARLLTLDSGHAFVAL